MQRLQANQGTVPRSAIFPKPGNPKRLEGSSAAYVNKRSLTLKINFVSFKQPRL